MHGLLVKKFQKIENRNMQMKDERDKEDNQFVHDLIHQKNIINTNKAFCSWECVKSYAIKKCPKHLIYERNMLIDLAAGYIVQCSSK